MLAPYGGPGITRFRNRTGPGGEGAFPNNPALQQRGKKKEKKPKQNTGVLFLLAKQVLCKLPEDLWHFKVFPFSAVLLQD